MSWIEKRDVVEFLNKTDYDVRKTGNGRWIDQKCTPDVLSIIADCILDYAANDSIVFTSMDIWHSEYAEKNVLEIFSKPNVNNEKARNEYDKFFQQPMELLAYSGVLTKIKRGNRNFYKVGSRDILTYISYSEYNALQFLISYISKVLKDSELNRAFERFFIDQTPEGYYSVKQSFRNFTIAYTKINGDLECGRIFTKVINPLAYDRKKCGTEKGRISNDIITLDVLMYNRDNFRDIYSKKPKGLTREEYIKKIGWKPNLKYAVYSSQKAKKYIRLYNDNYRDGLTEVDFIHIKDKAIQIHHIFPESRYPEISGFYENLIALTPNQHFIQAHPNGNTQIIDRNYQRICLQSKYDSIVENINDEDIDTIYEITKYLRVLDVGFDTNDFEDLNPLDRSAIFAKIDSCYSSLQAR